MDTIFAYFLTIVIFASLLIIFFKAMSCNHKWNVIKNGIYANSKTWYYDCQCEKCGKIKTFKD